MSLKCNYFDGRKKWNLLTKKNNELTTRDDSGEGNGQTVTKPEPEPPVSSAVTVTTAAAASTSSPERRQRRRRQREAARRMLFSVLVLAGNPTRKQSHLCCFKKF